MNRITICRSGTHVLISASAILLLTGCGSNPLNKEADELESVGSSASTVALAAAHWRRGNVPDGYARDTVQKAHDDVNKSAEKITELESKHSIPVSAVPQVTAISGTIAQVKASIAKKDRSTIEPLVNQLFAQGQQLETLIHSLRLQPP